MSHQKKRKSGYSKYKTSVKYYLCGYHHWNGVRALEWLNKNAEFVRSMYDDKILPTKTADIINERWKRYAR